MRLAGDVHNKAPFSLSLGLRSLPSLQPLKSPSFLLLKAFEGFGGLRSLRSLRRVNKAPFSLTFAEALQCLFGFIFFVQKSF